MQSNVKPLYLSWSTLTDCQSSVLLGTCVLSLRVCMNLALFCKSTEMVISTAVLLWFALSFFFLFFHCTHKWAPYLCFTVTWQLRCFSCQSSSGRNLWSERKGGAAEEGWALPSRAAWPRHVQRQPGPNIINFTEHQACSACWVEPVQDLIG